MDFLLRGHPEFLDAALRGMVPGVTRIAFAGSNDDVDPASVPETVWGGSGLIPRPAADESWEIVGGAQDSPAGTGARTVSLTTMAGTYVQSTQTIVMNGATAVPLTGTHRFCNAGSVLTFGGLGAPSQPLIIRVAGGGATRAVLGIEGILNQAVYTVPAGFTLRTHSVLVGVRTLVGGESAVFTQAVTSDTGRLLQLLRIPLASASQNPYRHEVAGGLVPYATVAERNTIEIRALVASQNNTQPDAQVLGLLYDNAQWPVNSPVGPRISLSSMVR